MAHWQHNSKSDPCHQLLPGNFQGLALLVSDKKISMETKQALSHNIIKEWLGGFLSTLFSLYSAVYSDCILYQKQLSFFHLLMFPSFSCSVFASH